MSTLISNLFVPTETTSRAAAPARVDVRCAHCAQNVPAGLIEAGAENQFCCHGCRAVFETINSCGLDSYYRLRDAADASTLTPAAPTDSTYESFDAPAFAKLYVTAEGAGDDSPRSVDLVLEGVNCAACVWLIERLPKVLPGVIAARLSLRQATVRVTWEPGRVKLSQIARAMDRFGYPPHAARGGARQSVMKKEQRRRLIQLGLAFALMGNTMLLGLAMYAGLRNGMDGAYVTFFRWLSAILGTISLAGPGATFFVSAFRAVRNRAMNLDVPIALALLVGGVAGLVNVVMGRGEIYFDSLTVLVFLLLVGRWMQFRQQRRADAAVELLFSLTPSTAHVIQDEQVSDVPTEALQAGDLVEIRPNELVPADGVVMVGRSAVNQALLTGEAVPASVGPGDEVHAGAQNVASVLRVRVMKTGADTRVGQLMRLVERGVQEKPAIVQFADRIGAIFVVVVTLAALGTFAGWSLLAGNLPAAIDHTVALLIVTCPCVLGLATPLTISIAIGRLARKDILVKSGAVLERLSKSGRMLLDKTGTLTRGELRVLEWRGEISSELRAAVAALEAHSTHPVARALVAAIDADEETKRAMLKKAPILEEIRDENDGGISAWFGGELLRVGSPSHFVRRRIQVSAELDADRRAFELTGHTAVLIGVDGRAIGLAVLEDSLREDSAAALARLVKYGWRPTILSGDAQPVVDRVAGLLGVASEQAKGEVTPEEKLEYVRRTHESAAKQGVTVMVGDGVNDAAALAAADVGVGMHGGAEAALAAADVYIARPGLTPLVQLVSTSRYAMRTIRGNLVVSLAYNVLAGTLAAAGMMTPLLAAILMPISSATVLSLAIARINSKRAVATKG